MTNNARHENETLKPYDEDNAVTAASKLFKLSLQVGNGRTSKKPLTGQAVSLMPQLSTNQCRGKTHSAQQESENEEGKLKRFKPGLGAYLTKSRVTWPPWKQLQSDPKGREPWR